METTIIYQGWGLYRDNGKESGDYCLGFRVFYRENGKENGDYYLSFRDYLSYSLRS